MFQVVLMQKKNIENNIYQIYTRCPVYRFYTTVTNAEKRQNRLTVAWVTYQSSVHEGDPLNHENFNSAACLSIVNVSENVNVHPHHYCI